MGKTIEPNNVALLRQLFYGSKDGILISSWIHTGSTLVFHPRSYNWLSKIPPLRTTPVIGVNVSDFPRTKVLPVKTKHHVTFLHGKSVVKFLVKLQQNVILTNLQNNDKKRKQKQQQQLDKVNHICLVSPQAKSFGSYGRLTFNRNPVFVEE